MTKNEAERAFLDASVAVWREIDKHINGEGVYISGVPEQLARDSELRKAERNAWINYRFHLDHE